MEFKIFHVCTGEAYLIIMKIRLDELRRLIREVAESEVPEKYVGLEDDPYIVAVLSAGDPKELAAAKRKYVKDDDAGLPVPSAGAFFFWHDRRKEELEAMGPAATRGRADLILRQRMGTGKAMPRKFG
jgi:hypothetical protein